MFKLDPLYGKKLGKVIAELLTEALKGRGILGKYGPVFEIVSFEIPDDPKDIDYRRLVIQAKQLGTVGPGECVFKFSYIPPESHIHYDHVIEGHRFLCHGFTCFATEWNGLRKQENIDELRKLVGQHLKQVQCLASETIGGTTIDWDYFQKCYFRGQVGQKTKDALVWFLVAVGILHPSRNGWEVYEDLLDQTSQNYPIELEGHKLTFTREDEAKELAVALEVQAMRLDKQRGQGDICHYFAVVRGG